MTTKSPRKTTTQPSSAAKKAAPLPSPAPAVNSTGANPKAAAKKRTTNPAKVSATPPAVAVGSIANTSEPPILAVVSRPQRGKLGQIITLLERDEGASLIDLVAATGWQAHSVRGAISTLKKKLGQSLRITLNQDGLRQYRLEAK